MCQCRVVCCGGCKGAAAGWVVLGKLWGRLEGAAAGWGVLLPGCSVCSAGACAWCAQHTPSGRSTLHQVTVLCRCMVCCCWLEQYAMPSLMPPLTRTCAVRDGYLAVCAVRDA